MLALAFLHKLKIFDAVIKNASPSDTDRSAIGSCLLCRRIANSADRGENLPL